MPIITRTQIVNMALGHIGEASIADYDGDTDKKAQFARLYYSQAVYECFEDMEWTFATKRAELTTASDDTPLFGYAYAFDLPADFIAIESTDPEDAEWRIEDNQLLTDQSTIGIVYTYDQTDTARWSAQFVRALSHLLAAKLAMPLTRKPEYTTLNLELYQAALAMARHQDSKQASRRIEPLDTLTAVRHQN